MRSDAPPTGRHRSSERNRRGFFVIGPQANNPSDLLAKLIGWTHCANPNPQEPELRRQKVIYRGREAKRRRYPSHGRRELLEDVA